MIEPTWIDERDALTLHDRLLAVHGGAAGVRDYGLLRSALARSRQHLASAEVVQLAATLTAGVERHLPLTDGTNAPARGRHPACRA